MFVHFPQLCQITGGYHVLNIYHEMDMVSLHVSRALSCHCVLCAFWVIRTYTRSCSCSSSFFIMALAYFALQRSFLPWDGLERPVTVKAFAPGDSPVAVVTIPSVLSDHSSSSRAQPAEVAGNVPSVELAIGHAGHW
jgi:hypothetical protein